VTELSVRDRGLLRLHFVQSCSIDTIGRMYGVHRATAARWIVRTRKLVASRVRRRLQQELGEENESDITSMIAALRSDMGLSITGLLGPAPSEKTDDSSSG
jgi:RNA polymerase sigma-70 factor (ECF subfamily)